MSISPTAEHAREAARTQAGQFGHQVRDDAPEALLTGGVRPRRATVLNRDLEPGHALITRDGSRLVVEDVESSSAMPGLLAVETELGTLYLDPEGESTVDEELPRTPDTFVVIEAGIDPELGKLQQALNTLRDSGFLAGRWYDQGSIESRIESITSNSDEELDAADFNVQAVRSAVAELGVSRLTELAFTIARQDSRWARLGGSHGDFDYLDGIAEDALRTAIDDYAAARPVGGDDQEPEDG